MRSLFQFAVIVALGTNVAAAAAPSFGTWEHTSTLPTPRRRMAIATDSNGLVYLAGGITPAGESTSVDVFDAKQNSWSSLPAMPIPAFGEAAAIANDKLFVFGGVSLLGPGSPTYIKQVQIFSFATQKWTTLSYSIATAEGAVARGANGKLYVVAGESDTRNDAPTVEFDPVTNAWLTRTRLSSTKIDRLEAQQLNGKIYAFGGFGNSANESVVKSYDPVSDSWTAVASMTGHGDDFASGASSNYLFAAGGNVTFFGSIADAFEVYDSAADMWVAGPPLPRKLSMLSGAFLENRFYVFGGYDGSISSDVYSIPIPEPAAIMPVLFFSAAARRWRR